MTATALTKAASLSQKLVVAITSCGMDTIGSCTCVVDNAGSAGWVSKMESDRRSERTKAGLERVKAGGQQLGRPSGSKDKKKRRKKVRLLPIVELYA